MRRLVITMRYPPAAQMPIALRELISVDLVKKKAAGIDSSGLRKFWLRR